MGFSDLPRLQSYKFREFENGLISFIEIPRTSPVFRDLNDEIGISCYPTEKLPVRDQSVRAQIKSRDERRYHLFSSPT